jgi:uncharacterized protein YceH (UPF0502 family)
MIQLTADESRVLGVLVEKSLTTPAQYPLTLNAVVTGCNQKSNRYPVVSMSEDDCMAALDSLRGKQLTREAMLSSSRVEKFRHIGRETLGVDTAALVILAELLLRGPQTVGELRGRASRMHPLDSMDATQAALDHLMQRDDPFVRQIGPAPGGRADRYVQLLCPDLHALDTASSAGGSSPSRSSSGTAQSDLARRITALECDVADLRNQVTRLTAALQAPSA